MNPLQRAKNILDTHEGKPITIKSLCREVLLNERKLKEGFKKSFGSSVYQYQLTSRMNKAKGLLKDGKLLIQEIATEIGYDDPSSFSRKFREQYNITPLQYRQQNASH